MLLNISSNRYLREGDVIRVCSGLHTGKLGKVVGFRPYDERPLVVQYPEITDHKILRESFSANEVELPCIRHGIGILDPLPPLSELTEGSLVPVYHTCGKFLCMRLDESDTVYTFIPTHADKDLRQIYETNLTKGRKAAIKAVCEWSYVTRLPHLVEFNYTKDLCVLCKTDPKELAEQLVSDV